MTFEKIQSHAKINLFLDVLSKRQDGYHEIYSLISKIDLHDDIEIEKVSEFETNLFDYLEANASDQLSLVKESGDLSDDISKSLDKLISDFKNSFAA